MSFKDAAPLLREMADLLAKQEEKDAAAGKLKDEQREKRRLALTTAQQVLQDYLNTGAPAQHWQKGQQKELF
ncbi:MAG: hypothetical protein ACRYFZ_00875 [Janthinobacterium lividum]